MVLPNRGTLRKLAVTGGAFFKLHVLRKRAPLFVSWNVTFRCNLRCAYCAACDARFPELETHEVLAGLDNLWDLGTRFITFSGGEPLLRADIGEIVAHALRRGFQVHLSTNGSLVRAKLDELRGVAHVNLSLDGDEAAHDRVRGEGAFAKTMDGIEACKEAHIPVSLQCTLSSFNLDCVDKVLGIAAEHKVFAMFQPATEWLDSSTDPNPIAPNPQPYRETMERLMRLKRQGAPISNSQTGLRHLAQWPAPQAIWCCAGALTCTVEPDGMVLACHQAQIARYLNRDRTHARIDDQVRHAPIPRNCAQCWCAPVVELGLVFSLRPEAILNAFRTFL